MIEQTAFTGRWADARAGGALALLRAGDERGAEALLRHYAPLMRYIIAPIVPDAQDPRGVPFRRRAARVGEIRNLRSRAWLVDGMAHGAHAQHRAQPRAEKVLRQRGAFGRPALRRADARGAALAAGAPTGARARADRAAAAGTGCSFTASITTASPPRRSPRSWERRSALWRGGSTASKRHCARRWEVTTHERPRI